MYSCLSSTRLATYCGVGVPCPTDTSMDGVRKVDTFPAGASSSAVTTAVSEKAVGDVEPETPSMEVGMTTVHVP